MAGKKTDKLRRHVVPGLGHEPEDALHLTGYVGRGADAADGAYRLYASLGDPSQYVEIQVEDVLHVVAHSPTQRVTVSIPPTAKVRHVVQAPAAQARFLQGSLASSYMREAATEHRGIAAALLSRGLLCGNTGDACGGTCTGSGLL